MEYMVPNHVAANGINNMALNQNAIVLVDNGAGLHYVVITKTSNNPVRFRLYDSNLHNVQNNVVINGGVFNGHGLTYIGLSMLL
jgi:hypothetical protein